MHTFIPKQLYNKSKNELRNSLRDLAAARSYLYGKDIIAEVTDGEYTVAFIDMYGVNSFGDPLIRQVVVKNDNPNHPVVLGLFMDWWEPDHKKYFGVTKQQWYSDLSYIERAEIEAALQLKLWVRKEYYTEFAIIYTPELYNKWWSEGGKYLSLSIEESNEYWKNLLGK